LTGAGFAAQKPVVIKGRAGAKTRFALPAYDEQQEISHGYQV
jgi:hypothetical protein